MLTVTKSHKFEEFWPNSRVMKHCTKSMAIYRFLDSILSSYVVRESVNKLYLEYKQDKLFQNDQFCKKIKRWQYLYYIVFTSVSLFKTLSLMYLGQSVLSLSYPFQDVLNIHWGLGIRTRGGSRYRYRSRYAYKGGSR